MAECDMDTGSGGLGAVSFGVSETVVEIFLLGLAALVVFGVWKLVKLLLLASK
jgi:hypothetical protein